MSYRAAHTRLQRAIGDVAAGETANLIARVFGT
jgi:hypothetical protein